MLLRAFGIREDKPKADPQAVAHCPLCGHGIAWSSGWFRSEADMWLAAYQRDAIDADTYAEKMLALEREASGERA